jgi:hypothetical protein
MDKIAAHVLGMSDSELAIWTRKAISDLCNGCKDPDTDCLVKEIYEKSQHLMLTRQEQNSRAYQNRLARQGKNIAESATCTTSEAVKALADASTREGEAERDHHGNMGTLKSRTSAKTLNESLVSQTRTEGGSLRGGDDSRPASHSGMPSVRNGSIIQLPTEQKKPYGSCGNVMLTDAEGRHLREVYGEDLKIAIDILDAYIENNGKAAKRYKNHAAVLRKGNWVYNKLLEMKNNEQRLNNSKHQGDRRSFKQQDRDHQTELMHKSLFAPSLDINDKREIANG